MDKYKKLRDYFSRIQEDNIILSFDDIEKILGEKLVDSAYRHDAYWNSKGSPTHVFPRAWGDVGFEIDSNKGSIREQIRNRQICFVRKVTYKSEIINALIELNGEASLKEIIAYMASKNRLPSIQSNAEWERNVSAELQRHCSQTKSYKGAKELFYSVEGLGKGFWGLLSEQKLNSEYDILGIRAYEKRIIDKVNNDSNLTGTEKKVIINARIGQGRYRDSLVEKFEHCIVTGCSDNRLLAASHIKPWSKCDSDFERISTENGLLLSPLYDKLFDKGLITFDTKGKMFLSKSINNGEKEKLAFTSKVLFDLKLTREMAGYLEYHNDIIFDR